MWCLGLEEAFLWESFHKCLVLGIAKDEIKRVQFYVNI